MYDTQIIVPCYNEAERLDVDAFLRFARDCPQVGFLFVDDGSSDGTGAILQRVCRTAPDRFRLESLPTNVGKAEAVRAGMQVALQSGATYCGYWDADLATPLAGIADFRAILVRHPDVEVVLGSRVRLLGRRIERTPMRHYLGRVFATTASLMLRMPVYDTQCGAKLFRVSAAVRGLFSEPFRTRWLFDVEILARLLSARKVGGPAGSQIYEYPLLEWRDVAGSKLRLRHMLRTPLDLWTIYRTYLRDRGHGRRSASPVTAPEAPPQP